MNENLVEWVGYAAMLTLMISFMMKDMKKLRIINTIGCLLFVAYGFMLGSYPIIITNAFILWSIFITCLSKKIDVNCKLTNIIGKHKG